jgi:hypothetical protein
MSRKDARKRDGICSWLYNMLGPAEPASLVHNNRPSNTNRTNSTDPDINNSRPLNKIHPSGIILIYSNSRKFGKPTITVMLHTNFMCWVYMYN